MRLTTSATVRRGFVHLALAGLFLLAGARAFQAQAQTQAQAQAPARDQTPAQPGDEKVWTDFLAWFKTAPPGIDPLGAYAAELERQKVAKPEIERRFGVIMRFFGSRTDGVETFYDRAYSRPATGRPEQDGFASVPSEFLIGAVKGLKPGQIAAVTAEGFTVHAQGGFVEVLRCRLDNGPKLAGKDAGLAAGTILD